MTTVAWDGKTLACDSQMTGMYKSPYDGKINKYLFEEGVVLIGIAGRLDSCIMLQDWVANGMSFEEFPETKGGAEIMRVDESGVYLIWDQPCWVPLKGSPHAIGSGGPFAMGAMKNGATAEEAVKIACELDDASGGDIHVVTLTLSPDEQKALRGDPIYNYDYLPEGWDGHDVNLCLDLTMKGISQRKISEVLGFSRPTIKKVLDHYAPLQS